MENERSLSRGGAGGMTAAGERTPLKFWSTGGARAQAYGTRLSDHRRPTGCRAGRLGWDWHLHRRVCDERRR